MLDVAPLLLSRRDMIAAFVAMPFVAGSSARYAKPAEDRSHRRCWMAWPARVDIWGDQLEPVRDAIARIARAISGFEPVVMLASPSQAVDARQRCGSAVTIVPLAVDDCWLRDSGPIFVVDAHRRTFGSLWNFDAWGGKQPHGRDATVAARLCAYDKVPVIQGSFVTEGGAWDFDGDGTALTTESAVMDRARNPHANRGAIEAEAKRVFGARKVVWLPGARDFFTRGHIDGIAKFVRPGVVLFETVTDPRDPDAPMLRNDLRALQLAVDARGRRFEIVTISRPRAARVHTADFCACYVNFYTPNGGVVMAAYGDVAGDRLARDTIASLWPGRRVVQLNVDALCAGGGSIHCVTAHEPSL